MTKKLIILLIALVFFAGCASEAQQQQPIRITLDMTRSFAGDSYISERGLEYNAGQGKDFVGLYFIFENISWKQEFYVNGYNMDLICNNVEYNDVMYLGPNPLEDVKLLPGGKTEGLLLYEVPKGIECRSWVYKSNLPIEMVVKEK